MSKTKYYLAAGALFCSAAAGLAAPISNTFAEGSTSYFDLPAAACVIENYNNENSTSVTTIEEVDFSKVTALECSNRGITNFYGITLFPNLERLDISYNYGYLTSNMNFSQNTKLKEINIKGLLNTWYDFSNNPDIETITTDRSLYLYTVAYVERTEDVEYEFDISREYPYLMDTNVLKFIDVPGTYRYPSINDIPYAVNETFGGYTHQIATRGGGMHYEIYLNGDNEVETHNPLYINNNCEETSGDYYSCNNSVYYGDTFDTDSIVTNTLAKIFNLSEYKLSKVEIVPPTANLELTTNTDTVKKGMALADANFTLRFYFDLTSDDSSDTEVTTSTSTSTTTTTPETGAFTANKGGAVAASISIAVTVIASGLFLVVRHFAKRQKS